MLFCRDNMDVLVTHSTNDGRTWSDPTDITEGVKKREWAWYATGPGVGIQLRNGARRGRLLIPCDHRNPHGYDCGSHSVYSDDGGKSWRLGGTVRPGANECQFGELEDGTVVMNTRMQTHSEGFRGTALSRDGGESWQAFRHDRNLPCPKCQASLVEGEGRNEAAVFESRGSRAGKSRWGRACEHDRPAEQRRGKDLARGEIAARGSCGLFLPCGASGGHARLFIRGGIGLGVRAHCFRAFPDGLRNRHG